MSKQEIYPIYTRTGDKGDTAIIGGRVRKDHARIEAIGTIDELNSFIGQSAALAADCANMEDLHMQLLLISHELFDCGADLAYANEPAAYKLTAEQSDRLEQWIDAHAAEAPELQRFILPGGSALAASLHICRTVCRRAERRVITFADLQPIHEQAIVYLNRLSDYLFAAARMANSRLGVEDIEYARSAIVFGRGRRSSTDDEGE